MNDYKLRLLTKRLQSGKCQIKFSISKSEKTEMYGYLLTESGTTLKDVVMRIEEEIKLRSCRDDFYHAHLYNLATRQKPQDQIILFNA